MAAILGIHKRFEKSDSMFFNGEKCRITLLNFFAKLIIYDFPMVAHLTKLPCLYINRFYLQIMGLRVLLTTALGKSVSPWMYKQYTAKPKLLIYLRNYVYILYAYTYF